MASTLSTRCDPVCGIDIHAACAAATYQHEGMTYYFCALHTSPNILVLFEGTYIRYCTTAVDEGDLQVILSMTYSTNPRIGHVQEIERRIKDIAYYGPRVLWD